MDVFFIPLMIVGFIFGLFFGVFMLGLISVILQASWEILIYIFTLGKGE